MKTPYVPHGWQALEMITRANLNHMEEGIGGNDAAIRIYPDVHIKGENINPTRAAELIPGTTDLTMENAGELIKKAGVTVRAKAECKQKITELLLAQGASIERKEIIEKARVLRKENQGTQGGGSNPQNPGDNGELG